MTREYREYSDGDNSLRVEKRLDPDGDLLIRVVNEGYPMGMYLDVDQVRSLREQLGTILISHEKEMEELKNREEKIK